MKNKMQNDLELKENTTSCHRRLQISGMTPNFKEEALNKDSFRAPLHSGFTLIELLVVVLIIGILAAVALPQYQKAVMKARMREYVLRIAAVEKAIEVALLSQKPEDIKMDTLDISIEPISAPSGYISDSIWGNATHIYYEVPIYKNSEISAILYSDYYMTTKKWDRQICPVPGGMSFNELKTYFAGSVWENAREIGC